MEGLPRGYPKIQAHLTCNSAELHKMDHLGNKSVFGPRFPLNNWTPFFPPKCPANPLQNPPKIPPKMPPTSNPKPPPKTQPKIILPFRPNTFLPLGCLFFSCWNIFSCTFGSSLAASLQPPSNTPPPSHHFPLPRLVAGRLHLAAAACCSLSVCRQQLQLQLQQQVTFLPPLTPSSLVASYTPLYHHHFPLSHPVKHSTLQALLQLPLAEQRPHLLLPFSSSSCCSFSAASCCRKPSSCCPFPFLAAQASSHLVQLHPHHFPQPPCCQKWLVPATNLLPFSASKLLPVFGSNFLSFAAAHFPPPFPPFSLPPAGPHEEPSSSLSSLVM